MQASILAVFMALFNILGPTEQVKMQLERVEQIGGEDIADFSKLRVRKYNRTVYALDGTLSMLKDLDNSYETAVKFAYSTIGNNQFNEYPMKLPQKSICKLLVEEYVDYQFIWGNSTNLPYVAKGTKQFCPFPKGEYFFKNTVPAATFIPSVVPEGLWRMSIVFLHPSDVEVMQFRIFYRVIKGMGM